ncbi:hypothetical protein FK429_002536 [Enterococcus faecalis]|nr:hypothetical protein [Enterococcus faecalis]
MSKTDDMLHYFEKELPKLYNGAPIRKEQVQLALDVGNFLFNSQKKFLFIDAPVGTGKSMGVLIPTLMYSKSKFKSLLYATATISLQNQIMNEEVPKLKKLNLVGNALLAMGKNNYTCRWNFEDKQEKFSKEKRKKLYAYFKNYSRYTGQLSEIEEEYELSKQESDYIRMPQTISNKKDKNCRECIYKDKCSSINHRKLFRSESNYFDITVTNHDQMIVSQKRKEDGEKPIVHIDKGVIVVDEAHLFIENYLGRTQAELTFNELNKLVGMIDNKLEEELKKEQKKVLKNIDELQGIAEITQECKYLLEDSIDKLENLSIRQSMKKKSNDELMDRIDECTKILKTIKNDSYISWIDLEQKKYCAASKKFLPEFATFISNLAQYNKVIFMSGTLTGTKTKEEIVLQWGLPSKYFDFYCYNTPFDYSKQAKVYIPKDIATPTASNDRHLFDVSRRIIRMTEISKGNLLVLCTSKKYMNTISNELKKYYKTNYDILTQGDKRVEMLTEDFKLGNKILVGSGSFFTGFSVAGKALTSVIITRLPFPTPNNPLIRLIGQNMDKDEKFNQVILPMMFNKLNQAMGRLIRDIDDYGIISILDPRIYNNSKYSDKVIQNLSELDYKITDSIVEINKFYENISKNGTNAEFVLYNRNKLSRLPIIRSKRDVYPLSVLNKINNKPSIQKKYIRKKSFKEKFEEEQRKEKILRFENEQKQREKKRSELIESVRPLENFRKKWKLQLFTQNQRDQGVEKCFISTVELINKKFESNKLKVIEDLFKEYPFSDKIEKDKYKRLAEEIITKNNVQKK